MPDIHHLWIMCFWLAINFRQTTMEFLAACSLWRIKHCTEQQLTSAAKVLFSIFLYFLLFDVSFCSAHAWSADTAGFMTYRSGHQRVINMFWLHVWGVVMSSVLTYSQRQFWRGLNISRTHGNGLTCDWIGAAFICISLFLHSSFLLLYLACARTNQRTDCPSCLKKDRVQLVQVSVGNWRPRLAEWWNATQTISGIWNIHIYICQDSHTYSCKIVSC